MSKPFFSVVIPSFNRADFILNTIKSVLIQSYENFEIVFINDGSTDNTEAVINSINDKRIKYHKINNSERGAARNLGGKMAKGEYITFLDSDDLFYQNHLKVAYEFILKNGFIDVFFQQYEILKSDGTTLLPYTPKNSPVNRELIEYGNFMSCHGVFLNRDVFLKNQFRENRNFNMGEDYELWLRVAANYNILYSPIVTSALVQHSNRSVENLNAESLIKKKLLLLEYLKAEDSFIEKIGSDFKYIEANTYLYIALHLSTIKKTPWLSINYLIKAIIKSVKVVNRRSFYVTVYKLIFA